MKATYLVVVVLTFFSGAIFGSGGLSFSGEPDWRGYFEVGSYLATILVAAVGVITMNTWRSQFTHSGKYNAIKEFQNSLMGRSVLVKDYAWSVIDKYHAFRNAPVGDITAQEKAIHKMLERKDAWNAKKFQIDVCWSNLIAHLGDDDVRRFLCAPDSVNEWVDEFVAKTTRTDPYTRDENSGLIYEEVVKFCESADENDKRLIESSQVILQRLVR
ncbi:hypothetical protein ACW9I6_21845 [Pseudomonas sp. SDO5522_S412]